LILGRTVPAFLMIKGSTQSLLGQRAVVFDALRLYKNHLTLELRRGKYNMDTINELIQKVIQQSESIEGFYEVEVTVFIRKDGGSKSDFFRAQSHWTPESSDQSATAMNEKNPFEWM